MPAYVIVEMNVIEPTAYEAYKAAAAPTVAQYGGRYIVRGGALETLEGDWQPSRVVLLEFDSMEQAKTWVQSAEYQAAKRHRQGATSTFNAVLVEGAP